MHTFEVMQICTCSQKKNDKKRHFIDKKQHKTKILGQKSYNDVAVLSKQKMTVTAENLPNFPDENARFF